MRRLFAAGTRLFMRERTSYCRKYQRGGAGSHPRPFTLCATARPGQAQDPGRLGDPFRQPASSLIIPAHPTGGYRCNKVDHRKLLRDMFDAAVAAASPALCVPRHLPPAPQGRTVVVGAGKAAAAMAAAVKAHWPGPIEGLVVTRYGHSSPCRHIEVIEAAHPVPDAAGRDAARRIFARVARLGPDDLVLCLLSGGGSALLAGAGRGHERVDDDRRRLRQQCRGHLGGQSADRHRSAGEIDAKRYHHRRFAAARIRANLCLQLRGSDLQPAKPSIFIVHGTGLPIDADNRTNVDNSA